MSVVELLAMPPASAARTSSRPVRARWAARGGPAKTGTCPSSEFALAAHTRPAKVPLGQHAPGSLAAAVHTALAERQRH